MGECIVEFLEAVEVDQSERRRKTMIQAVVDDLAISGLKNGTIGEPVSGSVSACCRRLSRACRSEVTSCLEPKIRTGLPPSRTALIERRIRRERLNKPQCVIQPLLL